jgi:hypothetical protein
MAAGRKVEFRTNAKGKIVGLHLHRSIGAGNPSAVEIYKVVRRQEDNPPEQE